MSPMEVAYEPSFDEQRRRYRLRFTCEHCVHFIPETGACGLGFPNEMHRLGHYEEDPRPPTILFCKEFDLA